jgi:hypothetical protein
MTITASRNRSGSDALREQVQQYDQATEFVELYINAETVTPAHLDLKGRGINLKNVNNS